MMRRMPGRWNRRAPSGSGLTDTGPMWALVSPPPDESQGERERLTGGIALKALAAMVMVGGGNRPSGLGALEIRAGRRMPATSGA